MGSKTLGGQYIAELNVDGVSIEFSTVEGGPTRRVVECIGDDVPYGQLTSFPRAVQAKDDEVVIFSWIVYQSRADRDAVMAKVMADPRLKGDMPFDGKRMIFGGFEMAIKM